MSKKKKILLSLKKTKNWKKVKTKINLSKKKNLGREK